ncbi:MAG: hypothetical protein LDLANPLL_00939 [Turneriella sp.]|nr:hypothetical protein [Turneriella sp.]
MANLFRLKNIAWENILLDAAVILVFQFGYQHIEAWMLPRTVEYFWYIEPFQLYLFAVMVARYVYGDASHGPIGEDKAPDRIPKPGYAFIGLGGLWLMFAGFQQKRSENWLAIILIFGHFIAAAFAALYGSRLANLYHRMHLRSFAVKALTTVQVVIGFIVLEVCFAAIIENAGGGNKGLAFRMGFFIWGLASFVPLRIFLMVQPPFHPLEIVTALAAYTRLFMTALA